MKVSIVISTKDRLQELIRCIDSCLVLDNIAQILVYDDGSSDNTFEYISNNYKTVSLYRGEKSIGLINARTLCASLAIGDIIVSIDDDCVFQSNTTINEITRFFNSEKIAVVTIPCIDELINPGVITQIGNENLQSIYISSQFRGCAHAVRKKVFLELGGYYDNLIRQEEETEFAMRLYNKGYIIRVGHCTKPIVHYHSPIRNHSLISYYRMRNQILVNYKSSPLILVIFVIVSQGFSTLLYEIRNKRFSPSIKGALNAIEQIFAGKIPRTPMKIGQFIRFKKLRKKKQALYI